jgi:hypothetical protein
MASHLEVHIDYLDGRPSEVREFPFNFPAGQEMPACAQLLSTITQTGGILKFGPDGISLTPLSSCKLVTVKAPRVSLSNLCELAAVTTTGKVSL